MLLYPHSYVGARAVGHNLGLDARGLRFNVSVRTIRRRFNPVLHGPLGISPDGPFPGFMAHRVLEVKRFQRACLPRSLAGTRVRGPCPGLSSEDAGLSGGARIDPAVFGYIRVSQAEGESGLATQRRTLNDHGLRDDRIFTDVASGKNMRRPSWQKLRGMLKTGDTVVVPRIDRLARNPTEGLKTIEELHGQGINIRSLAEGLDTGDDSPTSRLMIHMLLSLAEWERDTIRDRIKAGVDRAAAEGRIGGRPPALSAEKIEAVTSFLENGGSVSAAARTFGVSRPTVRAVRDGTYMGQHDTT